MTVTEVCPPKPPGIRLNLIRPELNSAYPARRSRNRSWTRSLENLSVKEGGGNLGT